MFGSLEHLPFPCFSFLLESKEMTIRWCKAAERDHCGGEPRQEAQNCASSVSARSQDAWGQWC